MSYLILKSSGAKFDEFAKAICNFLRSHEYKMKLF